MPLVHFEADGAVGLITLDRPPVNALSAELIDDLTEAIDAAADPGIRAVVVTGAPHFAAGADIAAFKEAMDSGGSASEVGVHLAAACNRLEALEKPVIAAVRGFALGGGLEIAMACDFRLLADSARVGQPEIKLGIIPGAGGTQRLPRLVGMARARDMVMSGRMVDAEEAVVIGLADRVIPEDALDGEALEAAHTWSRGPTRALALVKRVMTEGFGLPLQDALTLEAQAFADVFATGDARRGVDAFLEKGDPTFTGD